MKLGYGYILEYLSERFTVLSASKDRGSKYAMPVLYQDGERVEPGRIYVVDYQDVNECLTSEDILVVACCNPNREEGGTFSAKCRTICLETPEDGVESLYKTLFDLFCREGFWRESLLSLLLDKKGKALEDFLQASVGQFDGSLLYYPADGWHGCVYAAANDWQSTKIAGLIDENGGQYSKKVDYSGLGKAVDSAAPEMVRITDKFGIGVDILAAAVHGPDGVYMGLILAPVSQAQATQAQVWRMGELRDVLEVFVRLNSFTKGIEVVSKHSFLKLLQTKSFEDIQDVEWLLDTLGFSHAGGYACFAIEVDASSEHEAVSLRQRCAAIESVEVGCTAVESETDIVVLLDTRACKLSPLEYSKKVARCFSDCKMKIGVSVPFSDIALVRSYIKQAKAALDIGLRVNPRRRIHLFSNVVVPYILQHGTKEMPARILCAPGLLELRHKSSSGVDYIATLRAYVKCLYNVSRTAQMLGVHRTSVQYRLSHVERVTHMDLSNSYDCLYLGISLALLDFC